jgi:hypothetical protein
MKDLKENLFWLEKLINDTDKHKVINHKDGKLRFYRFGGFFNAYEINCSLNENGEISSIFHIGYQDPTGKTSYNSVQEMYQALVLKEEVGKFRANPKHYTL